MNISSKPLLAVALAAAFSCAAPGWAQSTAPLPSTQSLDEANFFPPMPPPEPMFDFVDEAMVMDAPPPPLMPAPPPFPFTISLAPTPEGDYLYFTGPDGPGPIAEAPEVRVQAGPQGAEVTVEDHGPPQLAHSGHGGPAHGGPGGPCPPGGGRGMCHFGGGPFGVLTGDLALKDDQLEKLHAIRNQFLDAVGVQQANLASYERQLRDTLSAATVDRAKATALQSKINDTRSAISNAKLASRLDSLTVLTDPQRQALHEASLKPGQFARMRFHRRF